MMPSSCRLGHASLFHTKPLICCYASLIDLEVKKYLHLCVALCEKQEHRFQCQRKHRSCDEVSFNSDGSRLDAHLGNRFTVSFPHSLETDDMTVHYATYESFCVWRVHGICAMTLSVRWWLNNCTKPSLLWSFCGYWQSI